MTEDDRRAARYTCIFFALLLIAAGVLILVKT